jgi:Zn-dependent peptidase ImmA (M78 family)
MCRTSDAALTWLRERAEDAGVLVMISGIVGSDTHRKLRPEGFRGFALADDYAPLVFINGADGKAAQVFTIAHELAHLWLGESALSDLDPAAVRDNAVERWCNQVAAELLVPMEEFQAHFDPTGDRRAQLEPLAAQFRVSTQVILGRIREAGHLSWDEFFEELAVERDRIAAITSEAGGGGGSLNNASSGLVGELFARALVASAMEGQTPYTEAFRLLDLKKSSSFDKLALGLGLSPAPPAARS